ncbi:helix-turn-helix transcriptional regulator [Budvicia diplopodorum]|uniref:helix-turn-helix transcriptional regulator n=1 Tax=Budvicia diplopodorum TaxID=1119056 RepID=UPI00135B2F87|nr:LuxR family transcriptional regulator [Budvicia diplopodorum]
MESFRYDARIKHFLEQKLNSFGIKRYSYFLSQKFINSTPLVISNYPDAWVSYYIDAELYLIDPVFLSAKQSILPFAWSEISTADEPWGGGEVLKFAQQHNLFDGYTFTIHDANNCMALLSFCNIDEDKEFPNNIRKYKNDIQMLLITVHDEIIKAIRIYQLTNNKQSILSAREIEILQWVSLGKTYIESAIILGIRERTIKFHMKNIVNKLNVSNAKHAIKKAIELHLLE